QAGSEMGVVAMDSLRVPTDAERGNASQSDAGETASESGTLPLPSPTRHDSRSCSELARRPGKRSAYRRAACPLWVSDCTASRMKSSVAISSSDLQSVETTITVPHYCSREVWNVASCSLTPKPTREPRAPLLMCSTHVEWLSIDDIADWER